MIPQVPTSEPLARLVHVDDAAREIERIGALVDEDGIRPLLDDVAQGAKRAVKVHRRRILHQSWGHLGNVGLLALIDGIDPVRRSARPLAVHAPEQGRYAGANVADEGRDDRDIAVHLLRLDVDLNEFLRSRLTPGLAFAVREKPVQAGADQQDDIGVFEHH